MKIISVILQIGFSGFIESELPKKHNCVCVGDSTSNCVTVLGQTVPDPLFNPQPAKSGFYLADMTTRKARSGFIRVICQERK